MQKYLPLKLQLNTIRTGDRVKNFLFVGIKENDKLYNLFWKLYNDDKINIDKIHGLMENLILTLQLVIYMMKCIKIKMLKILLEKN